MTLRVARGEEGTPEWGLISSAVARPGEGVERGTRGDGANTMPVLLCSGSGQGWAGPAGQGRCRPSCWLWYDWFCHQAVTDHPTGLPAPPHSEPRPAGRLPWAAASNAPRYSKTIVISGR